MCVKQLNKYACLYCVLVAKHMNGYDGYSQINQFVNLSNYLSPQHDASSNITLQ